jgi:Subtilisin inhibitor-like
MRTVKIVSAGAMFALATALPTTAAPASDSRSSPPVAPAPDSRSQTPAAAATGQGSRSSLALSVSASGAPARTAFLECDQGHGGSPALTTSCDMIRRVGGDLSKMAYDIDMICTDEYSPRTVRAIGTWEGRFVWFTKTYDNGCEMTALTGPVFSI